MPHGVKKSVMVGSVMLLQTKINESLITLLEIKT